MVRLTLLSPSAFGVSVIVDFPGSGVVPWSPGSLRPTEPGPACREVRPEVPFKGLRGPEVTRGSLPLLLIDP